jgi:hypothetical protein
MRPLAVEEVRPPSRYEPVRSEALGRAIEVKAPRSVSLGELLTVLFENRQTVAVALEEQLRAGQIEEPERIAEEVAIFNALIPGERELAATLFLEIDDAAELGRRLRELPGIAGFVHLEVDGVRAERVATGAGVIPGDDPVQCLRFRLTEEQCAALQRGADVALRCEHPGHRARTLLDETQRRALVEDLGL